jgi:hypothetical protein
MTLTPAEKQKAYRERRAFNAVANTKIDEMALELSPKLKAILADARPRDTEHPVDRKALLTLIDELWQTRAMNSNARMRLREMVAP